MSTLILSPYAKFQVHGFPHITDGDTCWAVLSRSVGVSISGRELIEKDYAGGTCLRLTDGDLGLNTPEKAKPGYHEAGQDLAFYCSSLVVYPVEFWVWEKDYTDEFGRFLGDVVPYSGPTAVEYMRSRGWAPYKKEKI